MYQDDPFAIVRAEKERKPEDEAPADGRMEFFAEGYGQQGRGHTVGRRQPPVAPGETCLYHHGRHIYAGKHCNHGGRTPQPRQPQSAEIQWRPIRPLPR